MTTESHPTSSRIRCANALTYPLRQCVEFLHQRILALLAHIKAPIHVLAIGRRCLDGTATVAPRTVHPVAYGCCVEAHGEVSAWCCRHNLGVTVAAVTWF